MTADLFQVAEDALTQALAQRNELHLPGARALHRERLERAITLTQALLDSAQLDEARRAKVRRTRLMAHAAKAEDARHGAGQLSRSAQRAPTRADCEDGWRSVEAIVAGAEVSAIEARRLATLLDDPRADEAARVAEEAAALARAVIEQRNHAYTFHADPGFSFGEGWYAAAAAVLAKVVLQIQPDQPFSAQAERFLRDAGLGAQLVDYRSRPRANKALPDEIARAFAAAPDAAAETVRAAFLGDEPPSPEVAEWVDAALADSNRAQPKVLVWVRQQGVHQPERNSTPAELAWLCEAASESGLQSVLIGDAAPEGVQGAIDLTLFWKRPLFQSLDGRRAQLQLFEHLRAAHALIGQIGVTTAGMDGPALMGLPTMYLSDETNPRMSRWQGAVPGYEEVVRTGDYRERVARTLAEWAAAEAGS